MGEHTLSNEIVLGFVSTIVTGLTSAVVYLFKLHYVDTKKALDECKEQHKSNKTEFNQILSAQEAGCKEELSKLSTEAKSQLAALSSVVEQKQVQIDKLQDQVFELAKSVTPSGTSIH